MNHVGIHPLDRPRVADTAVVQQRVGRKEAEAHGVAALGVKFDSVSPEKSIINIMNLKTTRFLFKYLP